MYTRTNSKGFTLIELLVVIAIIGLLASIISASLVTARAKGRDGKRVADIRTIQLALEQYYNDNLTYPALIYGSSSGLGGYPSLSPTYLSVVPIDPSGGNYPYVAIGTSPNCTPGGSNPTPPVGYHLGAALEQSNNTALTQAVHKPQNSNACTQSGRIDFYGNSTNCSTSGSSSPANCYDVTN